VPHELSSNILRIVLFCSAAHAEKRVALVIGNAAYRHAGELANPRNDADDFTAALKALGVDVITGLDLDKQGMEQQLRKFSALLSGADVGVFFYAGHGLQVNGSNYLVPVDAELSTADALEFEMVRLELVQHVMENAAKTNILFLDACRNNPLSRNLARTLGTRSMAIGRGFAPAESGVGTLISFSTQPGNVSLDGTGRNSPYSGALVKRIGKPGQDVLTILTDVRNEVLEATGEKQVPWENHALRARFYFNTKPVKSPEERLGEAERTWSWIKDTTNQVVLENFIRQFGDTSFGALARERLRELKVQRASVAPLKEARAQPDPAAPIPTNLFFRGQTSRQYLGRAQLLNVSVVNGDNEVVGSVNDLIMGVGEKFEGAVINVGTYAGSVNKMIGARLGALKIAAEHGKLTVTMPSATKEVLRALNAYSTSSLSQSPPQLRTNVIIPTNTFFKGLASSQYLARDNLLNAVVLNGDNQIIGKINDLIMNLDSHNVDSIDGIILDVGEFVDVSKKEIGVRVGALKVLFSEGKPKISMPTATKALLSVVPPFQRQGIAQQ